MPNEKKNNYFNSSFTGNFKHEFRNVEVDYSNRREIDVTLADLRAYADEHPEFHEEATVHAEAIKKTLRLQASFVGPSSNAPPLVDVETTKSRPPSAFLVDLLTPASSSSDDFVANLEELYPRWIARYGTRRAQVLWYAQCTMRVIRYWGGVAFDVFAKLPKT